MKNLNLTDGEIAILKGILFNEYNDAFIDDEGRLRSEPVWTWSVFDCTYACEACKSRRSMSGFIGSLVKKELVGTDPVEVRDADRCVWLTNKAKKLLAPLFEGWAKEDRLRRTRHLIAADRLSDGFGGAYKVEG